MMKLSSLQKGLVLHLPLDEEHYNPATLRHTDKTPYSNHGTGQSGNFTTDRMGQANRATVFNGSSDYIDCGLASSLDTIGDITIAFWMKKTTSGVYYLICKGLGSAGGYYVYIDAVGCVGYKTNQIGAFQQTSTDALFNDNDWCFVVITRSGATAKIYRDGEECTYEIQNSHIDPANLSSYNFYASQSNGGGVRFNGSMDDVRIYNRSLSQQEITSLYESYRPRLVV